MASRELRPIRGENNIAYVSLTRGYEAIIDIADIGLVEGFNWHAADGRYAVRNMTRGGNRVLISMHRAIICAPTNVEVDHINGNGFDNRRANLRLASRLENARNLRRSRRNSSGYKGVSWNERDKGWQAYIHLGGRNKNLGLFATPEAAHFAYTEAAALYYGEYARFA